MTTVAQFRSRFERAQASKQTNWERLYRQTMRLFNPEREAFYTQIAGEKKQQQLYTSTPYAALSKAANNLHASLTPHQRRWTVLAAGEAIPEAERPAADRDLERIVNVLFSNIFSSNFDLAVAEFYQDLVIGTGALMVQSTEKNPLLFTAVPPHELYISAGAAGIIDSVWRKHKVKARSILETWPDAQLPRTLLDMVKESPEKEVEVIEGTIPKRIKNFNKKTNKEEEVDGFGYFVCLMQGGEDGFLVERDMLVSPWIVSRWSVLSGEEWGRGPAVMALNDAMTLNQLLLLTMQGLELAVYPIYTAVDDGVINVSAIRLKPGAIVPVASNEGGPAGPTLSSLRSNANFDAGRIEVQRLEAAINDLLYADALGSINLPVKTATEISLRQQELSKRIGSAFGRLQYEFIMPLVNLCLYHLDQRGLVNMNDYKVDGHTIAIKSVSPLASGQAQEEVNNLLRVLEMGKMMYPNVIDGVLSPQKVITFISDQLNLPETLKATPEEQQQMQQQQMLMMAAGDGKQKV